MGWGKLRTPSSISPTLTHIYLTAIPLESATQGPTCSPISLSHSFHGSDDSSGQLCPGTKYNMLGTSRTWSSTQRTMGHGVPPRKVLPLPYSHRRPRPQGLVLVLSHTALLRVKAGQCLPTPLDPLPCCPFPSTHSLGTP